jgi:hypothetical protein
MFKMNYLRAVHRRYDDPATKMCRFLAKKVQSTGFHGAVEGANLVAEKTAVNNCG